MANRIVGDVEQACAVLNERKWLGQHNWEVDGESVYSRGYCIYVSQEAIALSQGLLDAERITQLERCHAELLEEHQAAEAENERLRGERDDYLEYWQPLLQAMNVSSIEAGLAWAEAMIDRSKQLAALQVAVEPFAVIARQIFDSTSFSDRIIPVIEFNPGPREINIGLWRSLLAAYDQQKPAAVPWHPEENCPSSECPEHGTEEPGKEKV